MARFRLQASPGGFVLSAYAGLILLAATALPWWRMENRAPQYGMRVLWVNVSPLSVTGDIKEIDGLGHYVGMQSIASLAVVERAAAPYLIGLVVLCALLVPFARPGRLRLAMMLIVFVVPIGFAADLWYWQRYAVTHLDPHASMNKIADRVRARLVGKYSVAQFKVDASFQAGFWLALVASANIAAFAFIERRSERASRSAAGAAAQKLGAVATAAWLVLIGASTATAQVIEVGPTAPHRTILDAVLAAPEGAEVLVRKGVYREHVVIDKPLVLRAEEGAVIDGGGKGTVVLITKGLSTIRGFTVRGSGDSLLEEDSGIKVKEATSCTVERNDVTDSLFGILARTAHKTRVIGNRVVGKDLPAARQGDGIRLQDANDSVVTGNSVHRSRDLAIWQSHRCVVRENHVTSCRYGLHYMYCDDHTFEDNVFEGNQTGGAIMYTRRLALRRNRFTGSRGPSAYGLLIKVGDDINAEGNAYLDNTRGIFLEDSPSSRYAKLTIKDSLIGGNDVGVAVQPTVSRVVFTGNAFIANRVQVEAMGGARAESNFWSEKGRGNYWSDYVGFDADGDGIGDTPYRLEQFFENLVDRWPAVGLLRMGPAVEALETAARAFPVVKPRPAVNDAHPLIAPSKTLGKPPAAGARPALLAVAVLSLLGVAFTVHRARRAGIGALA